MKKEAYRERHTASPCTAGLFFFALFLVFSGSLFISFSPSLAEASGINDTKHNLSVSGPGTIKSFSEDRICVFCHTPHRAYRLSGAGGGSGPVAPSDYTYLPLWGHEVSTRLADALYSSSTMRAHPGQPTGPTKLCLSCHDGTVALGAVAGGANLGIPGTLGDYPPAPGSPTTNLGSNLSTHHPVSFLYNASLPNPELASIASLPAALVLSGGNELHCSTCHNPHDNTFGNFLVMDNSSSQLCEACHLLTAWNNSAHPQCEDCHTPHFAVPPGEWLLNFNSDNTCLHCHSGTPKHTKTYTSMSGTVRNALTSSKSAIRTTDIKAQINKVSAHHASLNSRILSQRAQLAQRRSGKREVTCMGCHNPHSVKNGKASAADLSGALAGVSGIGRNGMEVAAATYEYEVCFKCHSDYSSDTSYVVRVVETTNMRLAFDSGNPSYHPVIGIGKAQSIPSIPSFLNPTLRSSSMVSCTDCHRDDEGGSRGPHGSSFPPILGERYETADGTPESYQSYALCYRCHNRDSILRDSSFKRNFSGKGGHSGHLAIGAPCSACHDAHGVPDDGKSGSHTHLINFDRRIVSPKQGNAFPVFEDTGYFSGNCTLVCHGKLHDHESYPVASSSSPRSMKPFLDRGVPGRLR